MSLGGAAFSRALGAVRSRFFDPDFPLTAIEIRPRALGIVRLVRDGKRLGLGAAACVDLPEGLVQPSINQPNITDGEAFLRILRPLLERAGVLPDGRVALVLPDPVARLALLPASDLGGRGGRDLLELVRFRLRKTVPFEVRDAQVAVLNPERGTADTVLVAAVFVPVLEGYEQALRKAGLEPGLVELSSLCLLAGRPPGEVQGDRLLVNWDHGYASLVLSRDGWPLLLRTLTEAASAADSLAREVANTVLYYRERLGGTALRGVVLRSADCSPQDAVALLREPLGFAPEVLDPWASQGGGDPLGAQAVAGAVSSVVRSGRRAA